MKTGKRIICLMSIIVLMICIAPLDGLIDFDFSAFSFGITASAEDVFTSGIFNYSVNANDEAVIKGHNLDPKDITGCLEIPETLDGHDVITIQTYAFKNCFNVTSVEFPNTLKRIEAEAFRNCSLSSVSLPHGLEYIGSEAFRDTDITEVFIPNTVTNLCTLAWHTSAFKGNSLKSVTLEEGLKRLDVYAFCGCTALEKIVLPSTMETIGYEAFSGCSSLENIDLPAGLKDIGSKAFSGTGIKTFRLPRTIDSLSNLEYNNVSAFADSSVKQVGFEAGITAIPVGAFKGCSTLEYVSLPDTITSINDEAFRGCSNLQFLILPSNLKHIQASAFTGSGIESVEIPKDIESLCTPVWGNRSAFADASLKSASFESGMIGIPEHAVESNPNLETVYLPSSLNYIGYRAFNNCNSISDVYYEGNEDQWNALVNNIGRGNDSLLTATIHFNSGSAIRAHGEKLASKTNVVSIRVQGRSLLSGEAGSKVKGSIRRSLSGFSIIPDNGTMLTDGSYEIPYNEALKSDSKIRMQDYQDYVIPKQVFSSIHNELLGCNGQLLANLNLDKKDGKSYISTVFVKENSGYSSYKEVTSDSLKFVDGKEYSVIISACDLGNDPEYYIFQDDNHQLHNSTGVFTANLFAVFTDKAPIYAYVVSSKGRSPAVTLNLEKTFNEQMTSFLEKGELKFLGEIQSIMTSGSSFLDKATIDLSAFKFPVDFEIEENTIKLSIGLSLWSSSRPTKGSSTTGRKYKNDKEYTNFVKDFKKLISTNPSEPYNENVSETIKNYQKAAQIKAKYDKGAYGVQSRKKKAEVSLLGYAEFEIINGNLFFKEGQASLFWSYSFSHSQQGFIWVVPEYSYFQATFELGGSGNLTKAGPSNLYPIDFSVSLSANPSLKVGGGIGFKDLASAGFWGKASVPITFNFTQKHLTMSVEGEFGYETKFLFIFGTEKTLLNGSINLIDKYWSNKKSAPARTGIVESGPTDFSLPLKSEEVPISIVDRQYMNNTSSWLGGSGLRSGVKKSKAVQYADESMFKTLQSSVFEGATPKIVPVGNTMMMVFVQDDPNRDTYNRMRLVYSLYNPSNDTWTEPQPVYDDGMNDVYPSLVTDGENTYVVWQKICKQINAETTTVKDICESTEIFCARFNSSTSSFDRVTRVTNDSIFNYAQQIAINNAEPVVYYASCSDNNMNGANNTNLFKYTNGTSTRIAEGLNYIYSIEANHNASEVAFIMDEDGSTDDNSDVKAFVIKDGTTKTVPFDSAVTALQYVELGSEEELLLSDTDNIYSCVDDEWQPLFSTITNAVGGFNTVSLSGKTVLTWAQSNEDGTSDLYYASFSNGAWSEPVRITEQDKLLSSVSLTNYNDKLYGVATQTSVVTDENGNQTKDQTDLSCFTFEDYDDILLEIISINEGNFYRGESCNFDVAVSNAGTNKITEVEFSISDTLGTETTEKIDVDLKPGETKTVTLSYLVPNDYSETEMTVTAAILGSNEERLENNTVTFTVGLPDLYFENCDVESFEDGYLIKCFLYNASDAIANNVEVSISRNDVSKESIPVYRVDQLFTDECVLLQAEVKASDLEFDEDGFAKVFLSAVSDKADAFEEDNIETVPLYKSVVNGQCGEHANWEYNYDTKALRVFGYGDMWDFSETGNPWIECEDGIKTVVIEDGVSSISSDAFWGCSSITNVTISSSVKSIGDDAFTACSGLTSFSVSEDNPYISSDENGCLYNKEHTSMLLYPAGKSETSFTIPEGVLHIGKNAFYGSSNLTTVEMPNSVLSVEKGAFNYCSNLSNVTLSDHLCEIEDFAFSYTAITEIFIPESVSLIGNWVFESCQQLERINVDCNSHHYSNDDAGALFNKDKTVLLSYPDANSATSYTIPDTVYSIGCAFDECNYLTEVQIPDSVTDISAGAFYCCDNLERVHLPSGLRVIERSTFLGCRKLKEINVPEMLEQVEAYAFAGTALKSFVFPDSVTTIGEFVFNESDTLESVTLPSSLETLETGAFYCCPLKTVVIPNSIKTIGWGVFVNNEDYYPDVYYYGTESQWFSIEIDEYNDKLFNAHMHYVIIDESTSISIIYDDEIFDADTQIDITEIPTENDNRLVWDITPTLNGAKVQPTQPVQVKLPIPAGWDKTKIILKHIKPGGVVEYPEFSIEGEYVVFWVDEFSEFSLELQHHEHTYNSGVVTTEPTCSAEGVMTYTCTTCDEGVEGHSYTASIPSTGTHVDEDNNGLCDGCNKQMRGAGRCKYCGQIHKGFGGFFTKIIHWFLGLFGRTAHEVVS